MNKQPEALRLAKRLVHIGNYYLLPFGMEASSNDQYESAAELRRLHEENERLRDAVAAEREACALLCDAERHLIGICDVTNFMSDEVAALLNRIRTVCAARGET